MEAYKREFIEFMVQSDVLKFGEFTLKSGRIAPYFINCGNYKTGAQLAKLGEYYAECVNEHGLKPDTLIWQILFMIECSRCRHFPECASSASPQPEY